MTETRTPVRVTRRTSYRGQRKALAQAWNDPTATASQVRELLAQVNPAAPVVLSRRRSGESYAQAAIRNRREVAS